MKFSNNINYDQNIINNNIISIQAIIDLKEEIPKSKRLEEEKQEMEDKIDAWYEIYFG